MLRNVSTFALTLVIAFSLTGCFLLSTRGLDGKSLKQESKIEGCQRENVEAPQWICEPYVEGYYASIGIVAQSPSGTEKTKSLALFEGRRNLAQNIKADVKDKVKNFILEAELGDTDTASNINADISREILRVDLSTSVGIGNWAAPSSTLYMHVTLEEDVVNSIAKEAVINSLKGNSVLWEKFQSKNYSKKLDKEFPTKE
ncbi:MAG: hypothetical protein ACJAWW_000621 [Sulfurimonas sp.]|jgi:hypothetical protein